MKCKIGEEDNITTYRKYVKKLNEYIEIAILEYNIERKLNFIQLKEMLLDYMNNLNTIHKEFYKDKLLAFILKLESENT